MIPQCDPRAGYLARRREVDEAVQRVLAGGRYILGEEVAAFEREFAAFLGAAWTVGVGNGTDAVELALRALGVTAGNRVITVSHTATATVAAIARIGALPLFADIDPQRYTLDPASLAALLETPEGRGARALVVVHLYGQAADMQAILPQARQHGIAVVEDCAQAHGARYHDTAVGCWGDLGCFSFYPTKNLGALGDGGAIVGRDPALGERLKLLREYGWRTRYVSEGVGYNSRLDELQAAILRVGLRSLADGNRCRAAIADRYDDALRDTPLTIPWRSPDSSHVFHQYVIRDEARDGLLDALQKRGVGCGIHYPSAVHRQPAYANPAHRKVPLTQTEYVVPRILSLPMFPELDDSQVRAVIEAVRELRPR